MNAYLAASFSVFRVVVWPMSVTVTSTESVLTFPLFTCFASVLLTVMAGLEIVTWALAVGVFSVMISFPWRRFAVNFSVLPRVFTTIPFASFLFELEKPSPFGHLLVIVFSARAFL